MGFLKNFLFSSLHSFGKNNLNYLHKLKTDMRSGIQFLNRYLQIGFEFKILLEKLQSEKL